MKINKKDYFVFKKIKEKFLEQKEKTTNLENQLRSLKMRLAKKLSFNEIIANEEYKEILKQTIKGRKKLSNLELDFVKQREFIMRKYIKREKI